MNMNKLDISTYKLQAKHKQNVKNLAITCLNALTSYPENKMSKS